MGNIRIKDSCEGTACKCGGGERWTTSESGKAVKILVGQHQNKGRLWKYWLQT